MTHHDSVYVGDVLYALSFVAVKLYYTLIAMPTIIVSGQTPA